MASDIPEYANSPLPISLVRDVVAMRNWWKRTYAAGAPGDSLPFVRLTDLVRVRNDSFTDLDVGHVLEVLDKVTADINEANPPWVVGDKPGLNPRQVVVLINPCPAKEEGKDGTYVLAQGSGMCFALIDIGDANHRRAYPVKDSHVLTSGWAGPAEIAWKPDELGEQLCLVRLHSPNTVSYWGVTSGAITAATYATGEITPGIGVINIWERNDSGHIVPTDGPASATALNYAPETIASGLLVRLASDDDWQLAIVGQFCSNGFA